MNLPPTVDRIAAITAKEFIHIRRDPRMIIAILVIPLMQLILFAYAISFDVRNIPTVVLDQDHTAASRAFLEAYRQSGVFRVLGAVDSLDAVGEAFESNRARAAVVVAPGFAAEQADEGRGAVQVLLDGSEPNSAQLGQAYARAINASLGQGVLADWATRKGTDLSALGTMEPRIRIWYNPESSSATFLVPGLMVVIVMIVTVQQTAVTLVRERDGGTLQQMIVSPLRRWELMVGKMLPWALIGLINTVLITAAAVYVFSVPLRGSIWLLWGSMVLFVLCSLGIGLIISARAPSVETANIVALLISFLPAFMLSGFAFPLFTIPTFLQWVSYLFPGRYMIQIARGVFLKGASLDVLWPDVIALAVYALTTIVVASALYRRRET